MKPHQRTRRPRGRPHSGGALEIREAASLNERPHSRGTIKARGRHDRLDSVGGELAFGSVVGPLEIEARNTEIKLDDIKGLKGPLRINAIGGEVRIDGLRTGTRVDGATPPSVALGAPAPVTIYNLGRSRDGAAGRLRARRAHTEGRINIETAT